MSDVHPWGDLPLPERFGEDAAGFLSLHGLHDASPSLLAAVEEISAWAYRLGYGQGRDDEAAGLSLKDVTAYVHVDDEGKSTWFRPADVWIVKR